MPVTGPSLMATQRRVTQAPARQVAHTLVYTYAVRDAFVKEAIQSLNLEGVVELTTDLDRATGVIATRAAVQVRGGHATQTAGRLWNGRKESSRGGWKVRG